MKEGNYKSLKSLAAQFTDYRTKKEAPEESDEKDRVLALIEEKDPIEDDFEVYVEFPRLDKLKTYRSEDIRPRLKKPARKKNIEFDCCDLTVELKDARLYEAVPVYSELQPFVLKNSHAVFRGLEFCDNLTIQLDGLGNTLLLMEVGPLKEERNLGCIVRYEFCRKGNSSLLVNARDVSGDVAVLGAPCEIHFIELEQGDREVESARLLNLRHGNQRHVKTLNQEAGQGMGKLGDDTK